MGFKVGDIVRGTCEVDRPYGVTSKEMIRGEVTRVDISGKIVVRVIEHKSRISHWIGSQHRVSPEHFKLYKTRLKSRRQWKNQH